jgi:hypothetical protein
MTISEMVSVYNSGPGADDAVDPELQRRGAEARKELIRMLESIPDREKHQKKAVTIIEMLRGPLASTESYEALERWFSRDSDPSAGRHYLTPLRFRLSGKPYEDSIATRAEGGTYYEDVRYTEQLLAVARPIDRMSYLVEAARAAWAAVNTAKEQKDQRLEREYRAKAKRYAEEILAVPNLAEKSGDGVYYGNHVLGFLALDGGDIDSAKRFLLDSAKASAETPYSGSELLTCTGPSWLLAVVLLDRGERESVCQYLSECKKFVNSDKLIDGWIASIRAGKIPDLEGEWLRKGRVRGARKQRR